MRIFFTPSKLIVATTSVFTERRSYFDDTQAGTGNCRSCWTICGSSPSTGAEMRNCGDRQLLILSSPFYLSSVSNSLKKLSFYIADAHFKRLRKTIILSCACYCVRLSRECLQRSESAYKLPIFTYNSFCNESTVKTERESKASKDKDPLSEMSTTIFKAR